MPRPSDELSARLVELTKDLVLFPSTVSRPEDRERCFRFVKYHLDAIDRVEVIEHRSEGFPSLLALPSGVERPEVLLCGHLDVVDQPDPDAYRPSIREGRIYGPGAGDMKGQLALLMEVFRDFHQKFPGLSLGLAIVSDEEMGGDHGVGHLLDRTGLRCGLAMIPDGGALNDITVEEKGSVRLELRCRGRAGHGARPWLAVNPLEKLTERLARLQSRFAGLASGSDRWYPTSALTIVRTANATPNRIPEVAEAVIDVRFPPPYTVERMLSEVRDILGEDVDIRPLMLAEPTRLSPDPLFQAVTEEVTGKPARLTRESGGSDARFFGQHGIPVIMSRPLVGNLHGENEWIDIESMITLYRIYEEYLRRKLVEG